MTTTTVYSPDTWPRLPHEDPRYPALLDWLKANGISSDDVPLNQVIAVHDADHGEEIRYVAMQRNAEGRVRAVHGEPVLEARATPCTVAPPTELDTDNKEQQP